MVASSLDGPLDQTDGLDERNSDADSVDLILFSWNDLDADLDDLDCFDADFDRQMWMI